MLNNNNAVWDALTKIAILITIAKALNDDHDGCECE